MHKNCHKKRTHRKKCKEGLCKNCMTILCNFTKECFNYFTSFYCKKKTGKFYFELLLTFT